MMNKQIGAFVICAFISGGALAAAPPSPPPVPTTSSCFYTYDNVDGESVALNITHIKHMRVSDTTLTINMLNSQSDVIRFRTHTAAKQMFDAILTADAQCRSGKK